MKITRPTLFYITAFVVIISFLLWMCSQMMKPAPPGIHGLYLLPNDDATYQTKLFKDSLLNNLEKEGLVVKRGKIHDYDPSWDSLRYTIDNIPCDTQKIEAFIEFKKVGDSTTDLKVLWFNAAPNLSYDTNVYNAITNRCYSCFETILLRHKVKVH